jgi:hypothetical protein
MQKMHCNGTLEETKLLFDAITATSNTDLFVV